MAALSVFTAVGVWNDYGTTLYFTQSNNLQTVQYMILKLQQTTSAAEQMAKHTFDHLICEWPNCWTTLKVQDW